MKKPKDISDSLGQCQANLAQSILGWMGLKFVYTKGQSLFIIKQWKYVGDVKKSSPEQLNQFQPNFAHSILKWWSYVAHGPLD